MTTNYSPTSPQHLRTSTPPHLRHPIPSAQTIWKGFHWSFFINIQGLILSLRRFEIHIADNAIALAEIELKTATELMLASSASMILAGSFSQQEYKTEVRTAMTPPHVRSNNFSGLMSWEHSALVNLWKRLRPTFASLPDELKPQHEKFVEAYRDLATAHKAVCEKFVGDSKGSLRCKDNTALNTLDKFSSLRSSTIAPNTKSSYKNPY